MFARLAHKDIKPAPASRLILARQTTTALAGALPGRAIHVVADAAYARSELRRLAAGPPDAVSISSRRPALVESAWSAVP